MDREEPELNSAAEGDSRGTTTPGAIVESPAAALLQEDSVLSEDSRKLLTQWIMLNLVSDGLARSVLPHGWSIADRSGADQNGSRGMTAVVRKKDRKPVFIAIYLTQTNLDLPRRDKVIADIVKSKRDKHHAYHDYRRNDFMLFCHDT